MAYIGYARVSTGDQTLDWVWLFRNDTELNKINILQRNMLEKRPLRG